ncbi:Glu/Leu/Phe/Val dehydrogenase [Burkholderiaceae bacterium FT117]|uniref:Glu/Leu/Phe/Val family dehydrogenase n=1 Tax=Zeimonas sediminis TaxID=2944268 RepID=UPI0023431043|nr:Glu/Leu/Phe/Val dehydrogenase [Zeimonas sediminis]MCM5569651.1 Glu/Leu/Phe/Val dehydrogenase [Zeimonas sediminis]
MSDDAFRFCDDLGPKTILHIHEPAIGLKAILVVDNVAAGPSIGGLRMAPDVSLEECFRLARAMTFKNAAALLPHGGGKAVIVGDPAMDPARKEHLIRAFAQAIGPIEDYIVGPDMGTNEAAMAWIRDEIGRSVGLPREIGGIPLDEIGATGHGLVAAAEVAAPHAKLSLQGARVAVQGFGSVGKHAARLLADKGAVLVAAADSQGTLHDPKGLDVAALIALKEGGGHLAESSRGEKLDRDAIVGIDCDIWISAARPDVIREDNVGRLKARLVLQGANIGVTAEAERALHERGVVSVPDFIGNAGGVICAAVEYRGGSQSQALERIRDSIRANTAEVLERSAAEGVLPREAAVAMAEARVRRAMGWRRWR